MTITTQGPLESPQLQIHPCQLQVEPPKGPHEPLPWWHETPLRTHRTSSSPKRPMWVYLCVSGCYWLQGVGHGEGGGGRDLSEVRFGRANVSRVSHLDHSSHRSAGYRTGRTTPPGPAGQRSARTPHSDTFVFLSFWGPIETVVQSLSTHIY